MSTLIIIVLALIVIFWRAPFNIKSILKGGVKPVLLILICLIFSLLFGLQKNSEIKTTSTNNNSINKVQLLRQ